MQVPEVHKPTRDDALGSETEGCVVNRCSTSYAEGGDVLHTGISTREYWTDPIQALQEIEFSMS